MGHRAGLEGYGKCSPHRKFFVISRTLFILNPYLFLCRDCTVFFVLTVQHTQLKHPCSRWDSNPQPQQVIGRKSSPWTARPLGSADSNPQPQWSAADPRLGVGSESPELYFHYSVLGFDPQTASLVGSRNTDWAIPAHERIWNSGSIVLLVPNFGARWW